MTNPYSLLGDTCPTITQQLFRNNAKLTRWLS